MLIKGIPWFLILLWSLNPQQKQKCFNFLCSSLGLQKTWIPPKGDEIRSRWPDRHLSSHSSPSAQGLRQAQTELLDWSRTHTHNEFPPSACVPVSVFDELWLARLRVSLQSGAAMLGQLSAAVGIIQTDRQTERSAPPSCDNLLAYVLWGHIFQDGQVFLGRRCS